MVDWLTIIPLIAEMIGPKLLEVISNSFKSTPEEEKKELLKLLKKLSSEIYRLSVDARYRSKKWMIREKLHDLLAKLDSQEYQQTLRPNVAGHVISILQRVRSENRVAKVRLLKELRTLINTWIHDLRFQQVMPDT